MLRSAHRGAASAPVHPIAGFVDCGVLRRGPSRPFARVREREHQCRVAADRHCHRSPADVWHAYVASRNRRRFPGQSQHVWRDRRFGGHCIRQHARGSRRGVACEPLCERGRRVQSHPRYRSLYSLGRRCHCYRRHHRCVGAGGDGPRGDRRCTPDLVHVVARRCRGGIDRHAVDSPMGAAVPSLLAAPSSRRGRGLGRLPSWRSPGSCSGSRLEAWPTIRSDFW